jgi:heme exporter protein A
MNRGMKLIVDNLACRRGTRTIFADLSFEVEGGKGMLLTGPNGAGKTTLLRTLASFIEPAEGTIRLEGGDPERELAEQCHYVGHHNGIKHSFTVGENLDFLAAYLGAGGNEGEGGAADSERRQRAIATFGLEGLEDIPAGLMSAGQKRRLGLARLVLVERPVWFLDEPSVSLDVASVEVLAGVVTRHIAAGGIAIAATHVPLGLDFTEQLRMGG